MGLFFGLTMFICIESVLLIYLFYYPKKWKEKKIILGVKKRKEFSEPGVEEKITEIVEKAHKQAVYITVGCSLIAVALLFLKGFALQTFIWTCFIFAALIADMMPYLMGHKQLMALKKEIGLSSEKGVSYVDISNAGRIHALKPVSVLVPNIVCLMIVLVAFLIDLGVIAVPGYEAAGLLAAVMSLTFWLVGILITVFAFVMDNFRSEVISSDSDVNANYNRAKKMNMAKLYVLFIWINTIYTAVNEAGMVIGFTDMWLMISIVIYLVLLMGGIIVFVYYDRKIDALYQKETEIVEDDDEYWIGGMIYYNPKDKRLNVEKRMGVGGTVNMAHPVGKLVSVALVLCIIGTFLSIVWIGMVEATPIRLSNEDGKVICHQLRDEYVIPVSDIESAEYGEDLKPLKLMRTSGVGMDTLLKGNFSAEGHAGCKVFLNPQNKAYIKIVTKSGQIYYVGGVDAAQTKEVFNTLK